MRKTSKFLSLLIMIMLLSGVSTPAQINAARVSGTTKTSIRSVQVELASNNGQKAYKNRAQVTAGKTYRLQLKTAISGKKLRAQVEIPKALSPKKASLNIIVQKKNDNRLHTRRQFGLTSKSGALQLNWAKAWLNGKPLSKQKTARLMGKNGLVLPKTKSGINKLVIKFKYVPSKETTPEPSPKPKVNTPIKRAYCEGCRKWFNATDDDLSIKESAGWILCYECRERNPEFMPGHHCEACEEYFQQIKVIGYIDCYHCGGLIKVTASEEQSPQLVCNSCLKLFPEPVPDGYEPHWAMRRCKICDHIVSEDKISKEMICSTCEETSSN